MNLKEQYKTLEEIENKLNLALNRLEWCVNIVPENLGRSNYLSELNKCTLDLNKRIKSLKKI